MKARFTHFTRFILILSPFLAVQSISTAQGIIIQPGASIYVTGNPSILIDNGNLVNNGTYTRGTETITMSGNSSARMISGSSNSDINNLTITNTAGVTSQLGLLTLNNLNIVSGGKFTVNPGKNVTVNGDLTNSTGNAGLVLKSNSSGSASLLHSTSGAAATVERYINNDGNWHFLSTAVSSQAIWPDFAPSPAANSFGAGTWDWDFFYYNPNAENSFPHLPWVNLRKVDGSYNDGTIDATGDAAGFGPAVPTFIPARGYLVEYAGAYGLMDHSFTGSLNSGSQSFNVTYSPANAWNLAGNPYPSAIDWKASSGWARSSLYGDDGSDGRDMWIWNDVAGNYGTYNSAEADDDGTNGAGRYIPSTQGFFVVAASSGSVTMNDNVRIHNAQSWLKNASTGQNSLRLKLTTSATGYSDEMAVKVNPAYSNSGSYKLWSFYSDAPEIYCTNNGNSYSTLRMSSLDENHVLDIGIKTGLTANYSLSATNLESFEAGIVILEDLVTGVFQDLKVNPVYTFEASAGDNSIRLRLHFKNANGIQENSADDALNLYYSNHILFINAINRPGNYSVAISNMLGQVIYQKSFNLNTLNRIELNLVPAVYVVAVESKGHWLNKKIVIN